MMPTMTVTIRPMWRFVTKRAAKPARPPMMIHDSIPMLPPLVVIRRGIATTLVSGQEPRTLRFQYFILQKIPRRKVAKTQHTPQLNGTGVFEPSILLAMVVYGLVAWGLIALIEATGLATRSEHVEQVERVEEREDQGLSAGQAPIVVRSDQLTPSGPQTVTTTSDGQKCVA
jgi:hypothetical protein